jgi:hypothetical protein
VPIRKGQKSAEVSANLSDGLHVTRKFRLDDEGRVTSTLEIANADGSATFKSPQAMLDRLLGGAAFYDPLAFSLMRPGDRREAVRKIVGLDFSVEDARRRRLLDDKLAVQRRLESAELAIEGVKPYDDAPAEEIDPAEVLREIEAAEETHKRAELATRSHESAERTLAARLELVQQADLGVEEARRVLAKQEARAAELRSGVPALSHVVDLAAEALKTANDARVDPAPLKAKMADVVATNKKIAFNQHLVRTEAAIDAARLELAATAEAIAVVDQGKRAALEAAAFPVPGMSFSDDDVLLDGLPFDQASTAQKLRASVAMALSRAGALRVLLVKAGNDLDAKNLALLADLAREHRAQVWVERVADDPSTVTVFVEDGSVRA